MATTTDTSASTSGGFADFLGGVGGVVSGLGGIFGGDGTPATTTSTPQFPVQYNDLSSILGATGIGLLGMAPPEWQGDYTAPLSSATKQWIGGAKDLYGAGTPGYDMAMSTAMGELGYAPGSIGLTGPNSWMNNAATGYGAYAMEGLNDPTVRARQWTPMASDYYMSPYMDDVLSAQEDAAALRYAEQQAARDLNSAQTSTFGGSRRAVADSLAQRDYNEQMNLMQLEGRERAFNLGRDQFNADADRRMQGDIARGQLSQGQRAIGLEALSGLGGLGQFRQQYSLDRDVARENADLNAARFRLGAGEALAGIEGARTTDQLQRLAMLGDAGQYRDQIAQRGLEAEIADYYRKGYFPLETYMGISQTLPRPTGYNQQSTEAAPNKTTQIGGIITGLGGLIGDLWG